MTGNPTEDPRVKASQNEFWDPHFVFGQGGPRTNLVAGIQQLANSTGLAAFLPGGYETMLSALIAYRNKMFHNGFEWPKAEREKFDDRIVDEGWPAEWFTKSTSDDKPWIFYMSNDFIQHCLATIDDILEGVGAYLKQRRE